MKYFTEPFLSDSDPERRIRKFMAQWVEGWASCGAAVYCLSKTLAVAVFEGRPYCLLIDEPSFSAP
jgi:hypothetical protein